MSLRAAPEPASVRGQGRFADLVCSGLLVLRRVSDLVLAIPEDICHRKNRSPSIKRRKPSKTHQE